MGAYLQAYGLKLMLMYGSPNLDPDGSKMFLRCFQSEVEEIQEIRTSNS